MIITDEAIERIEEIFGFSLYEWQKKYLKGEVKSTIGGRKNGNTFAYFLKLLLSDGKPIRKKELVEYADVDNRRRKWVQQYCLEINQKLVENGFETVII